MSLCKQFVVALSEPGVQHRIVQSRASRACSGRVCICPLQGYTPYDLIKMFQRLDTDGDNYLTFDEFRAFLPMLRVTMPDELAQRIFETFDGDGEGSIDFEDRAWLACRIAASQDKSCPFDIQLALVLYMLAPRFIARMSAPAHIQRRRKPPSGGENKETVFFLRAVPNRYCCAVAHTDMLGQ